MVTHAIVTSRFGGQVICSVTGGLSFSLMFLCKVFFPVIITSKLNKSLSTTWLTEAHAIYSPTPTYSFMVPNLHDFLSSVEQIQKFNKYSLGWFQRKGSNLLTLAHNIVPNMSAYMWLGDNFPCVPATTQNVSILTVKWWCPASCTSHSSQVDCGNVHLAGLLVANIKCANVEILGVNFFFKFHFVR